MIQTATAIIMAISMWCGEPQRSWSPGLGAAGSHSINDLAAKNGCQKSIMSCMGPKTLRWDGDKLYACLMDQKWAGEK